MKGIGLVFMACKLILRFAARYYGQHRNAYAAGEQVAIDNLIVSANALVAAVEVVVFP